MLGTEFGEGDATKQQAVRRSAFFHSMRARQSVNKDLGEEIYLKGNSVKRSGPFIEPPDSEN